MAFDVFGFLWHSFGHLYQFSHPSTSASLQDTSAAGGFLLLVAAAHETAGPVPLASPKAECAEGALWRGFILEDLYREEVGSFRDLSSRLQPTWCTKTAESLLPRH